MNKRQATKWVKALRSGKYQQGKEVLFSEGRYCCLGVLCEISEIEKNERGYFVDSMGFQMEAVLSGVAGTKLGLEHGDGAPNSGTVEIGGTAHLSLAIANDSGASLADIATWIESNYKQL